MFGGRGERECVSVSVCLCVCVSVCVCGGGGGGLQFGGEKEKLDVDSMVNRFKTRRCVLPAHKAHT